MMKLILQRVFDNGESTIGYLSYNGKLMFTLEDTFRKEKLKGITRIPAGTYELNFNKNLTAKTMQYFKKYFWFSWHLELKDIPNFTGIYMHIGNRAEDSEGCILCAKTVNNNSYSKGFISNSTNVFKEFYLYISGQLAKGRYISIEIRDEMKG
jgi:hypothetical protein